MRLTSPAFEHGQPIPARYTCDGEGVSPPLLIHDLPEGTASLALIVDDPDAPMGTWDHWVAYNIPLTEEIGENAAEVGDAGSNSWGRTGWGGPCPPDGMHRYLFRIYALGSTLGLDRGATKEQLLAALEGNTLGEAELVGTYARG
jgi:Raf kinase inhibitor-like YbhB/YbcL family protein